MALRTFTVLYNDHLWPFQNISSIPKGNPIPVSSSLIPPPALAIITF